MIAGIIDGDITKIFGFNRSKEEERCEGSERDELHIIVFVILLFVGLRYMYFSALYSFYEPICTLLHKAKGTLE